MSSETENRVELIEELLGRVRDACRYEWRTARLKELEQAQCAEGFWGDQEAANKVIQELKTHKGFVDAIQDLDDALNDTRTLLELALEEDDASVLSEADAETRKLLKQAEALELRTLLNGRFDPGNCYLEINAGAGGTESCDWAEMLKRMYLRWAERHRYKASILDDNPGEETGTKKCTIHLQGPYAFGYLQSERGVHRLVRISPFDAKSRRHTSFVSVDITPEVEDIDLEINESDLRVDTYRASGAGGQHVNTTDSAVRITHLPTGIVVQCQNERSQHSNRAAAMRELKSRLIQHEEMKRDKELASMAGEKGEIAFGSQIRSYVLHPYKMVKDHRTEVETGNVDQTLDGALTLFIEAYLRWKTRGDN
ncbi:MAG: peptide chain release factor 2 [Planctomycetes bacterium]|nr:peptide chain release factor 2 [Planctomycetota bacterium]